MNRATYFLQLAVVGAFYAALIAFNFKPHGAAVAVLVFAVPRLHDLGRTGWWALLFVIGQMVLISWDLAAGWSTDTTHMASTLYLYATLLALIVLGAWPGQKEANRFGPAPKSGFQWRYGLDGREAAGR